MNVVSASPVVSSPAPPQNRRRLRWTPEARAQQRARCLATQPWQHATGPRTDAGKQRAAANGRVHRRVPGSVRHSRESVADVPGLAQWLATLRTSLGR
jgi:hypothetical protein